MSNKVEFIATVHKLETIGYKEPQGIRVYADPIDGPGWVTIPLDLGIVPPKIGDEIRVKATWGPLNEPFPEDGGDFDVVAIPDRPEVTD